MTIFSIALIAFIFGMFGFAYSEYNELKKRGAWKYFTSLDNYNQLLLLFFGFCYIIMSVLAQFKFYSGEDEAEMIVTMRLLRDFMVLVIMFNVLELFLRVRIFDFFAMFTRQMQEIVVDMLPLASVLGFIVLAQTLMFWTID